MRRPLKMKSPANLGRRGGAEKQSNNRFNPNAITHAAQRLFDRCSRACWVYEYKVTERRYWPKGGA